MVRLIHSLSDLVTGTAATGHVPLFHATGGWKTVKAHTVDVRAYGATGDGSTDDAAAIALAITDAGVGGTVLFPPPAVYYKIGSSLTPLNHQTWEAGGFRGESTAPVLRAMTGLASPVIYHAGASQLVGWTARGLSIKGSGATSGNKGIHLVNAGRCRIEDFFIDSTGDEAILIEGGAANYIERGFVQNAILLRTGRSASIGAVDVGSTDSFIIGNEVTTSSNSLAGSGNIAAFVLREANGWMAFNIGEISETGFVLTSDAFQTTMLGNRADLNRGNGFVTAAAQCSWIGNRSWRNGRQTDNTYDAFVVENGQNSFIGNLVYDDSADTTNTRHGFTDSHSGGSGDVTANQYLANRGTYFQGNLYNITGASEHGVAAVAGRDFQIGANTSGGAFDTGHLRLGGYHLWVDSTGDLRIKSSAPTTDTDGAVVGSQS